jgi:multidrug efflux system outer membrane protein
MNLSSPIFILLSVNACLILSGCLAPKVGKTPELPLTPPTEWESNVSTPDKNRSTEGWAFQVGGEELNALVDRALSDNPSLLAMGERLIALGEQATILGAQILPTAQAELTGSRSKRNLIGFNLPNGSTSFTSNSFTSGLNISWELDLWGKLADVRDSAEKSFWAGDMDLLGAQISLAGQVAKAWYEVIEGTQQVMLAQKTAESFAQNQNFVEERFRKGLANALDQKLAQTGTAHAQAKTLALQGQLDASKRRLNILLGQYPSVSLDQNLSVGSNLLPLEVSQSSPGSLLANRPDLLAAEQKAQASGLDLSVARKNFFPSLSLSGGPGSRSDEFENLLDNNFRTWGINGSLSQPLFNGGRLRAAHRQAKALQAAAWADYRSHALNAFVEVENVLAAEIRLAEQETLIKLAAQSAEDASKLSWERYQRGVEAIFNALENQRRAFDARSQVYLIRKQRVHNRIDLHLSLGQSPLSE